jgi:hypothetical protein
LGEDERCLSQESQAILDPDAVKAKAAAMAKKDQAWQ